MTGTANWRISCRSASEYPSIAYFVAEYPEEAMVDARPTILPTLMI
jgi:hypothetical protein